MIPQYWNDEKIEKSSPQQTLCHFQLNPYVKWIQVCSKEGPRPFLRGDKIVKIHWWNLSIFFSLTPLTISTKLGTKPPWVKETQVCSKKWLHLFPRGDNNQRAKIHMSKFKTFFSRSTGLIWIKQGRKPSWVKMDSSLTISTKLGTKPPWVKETQVCSKKWLHLFPRGDNNQRAKIHLLKFKTFFSRSTGLIWIKQGKKPSWVKMDSSLFKWRATPFSKGRYK